MEKTMIDQISMRILECEQPVDAFFVYQKKSEEAELHGISLNFNGKNDEVSPMLALGDSLDRFLKEEGVLMIIDGAAPERHVYAVDFNPEANEIYFFNGQETKNLFDLIEPQIASLAPNIPETQLIFAGSFPGCTDKLVFTYGSTPDSP